MRFVRLYFYATTFDKITKDRAAKFVDMLSAIGGTMGLLTGFSIISAVEIVYFGVKIMLKFLKDRQKQMKNNCKLDPLAPSLIEPSKFKNKITDLLETNDTLEIRTEDKLDQVTAAIAEETVIE